MKAVCRVLPRDLGDCFGRLFCGLCMVEQDRSLWSKVCLQRSCTFKCCVLFYLMLCLCIPLLQPLLNSSVNPAMHPLLASVLPSCYRAVECVKPETNRKRVGTVGTSLDTPSTSSHVHFPNCMCSIKEICIPFTEMMSLSEMMQSEVLVFLERQKVLGYRDVNVYQIMLNIHENLFSSK